MSDECNYEQVYVSKLPASYSLVSSMYAGHIHGTMSICVYILVNWWILVCVSCYHIFIILKSTLVLQSVFTANLVLTLLVAHANIDLHCPLVECHPSKQTMVSPPCWEPSRQAVHGLTPRLRTIQASRSCPHPQAGNHPGKLSMASPPGWEPSRQADHALTPRLGTILASCPWPYPQAGNHPGKLSRASPLWEPSWQAVHGWSQPTRKRDHLDQ